MRSCAGLPEGGKASGMPPQRVTEVALALSDPDPVTRGLAAIELRARGQDARFALDALAAALRDPDANVRLMSGNAIAALKARLALEARVKREGQWTTVPARELVPGDVIRLRIGDIIPADAEGVYHLHRLSPSASLRFLQALLYFLAETEPAVVAEAPAVTAEVQTPAAEQPSELSTTTASSEDTKAEDSGFYEVWRPGGRSERRPHRPRCRSRPSRWSTAGASAAPSRP